MLSRYQEDAQLATLAKEILSLYSGQALDDARAFKYRIIFTNATLGREEIAGKCSLVHGPVRFLWDNDFIIEIHKPSFDAMTGREKTRILVHELHHIGKNDDDDPKIRRHAGDFCEIAEHDKLSYAIADAIYKQLKGLEGFTTQQEVAVPIVA